MAGTGEKTKRRKASPPESPSSSEDTSASARSTSTHPKIVQKKISAETFSVDLKSARERSPSDSSAGLPTAPWFAISSDSYRVRQFVLWLSEQILPKHQTPTVYFGGDLTQSEVQRNILQTLTMPSLFEPRQFIVIYNADVIKPPVIQPLLSAAAQCTHAKLLLSYTDEKKVPEAVGTKVLFEDLKGQALRRWIERELKKHNFQGSLEDDAMNALINKYEGALLSLSHELQKLALITRPNESVSLAALRKITQLDTDADSFALLLEIARKNVIGTTALTHRLLEQGLHPLQIVAFLSRCLRTLMAKRSATPGQQLHPELTNYYFVKNLDPISSLFQMRDLTRSLSLLTELDMRLKSTALDPETLVEITSCQLAARQFDSTQSSL